ncbi:hypothetical protein, partial [Brachybacterium sp. AOP3-A1-3]|uniref:hypothetical protein n=1 Tax=Brachybacterium sp. AOP3-A1-3 TaxID=3457699 RepID=UPI0040333C1F
HNFVGRAATIDLPDGSELCTTIEGVQWAKSGPIGVHLAVPYDDDGRRYIELDRDAPVIVPRPDDV